MTKLLENVLTRVRALPDDKQDTLAQIILEELDDDQLWDEKFRYSQDALSRIAAKVREDVAEGRVKKMGWDEL